VEQFNPVHRANCSRSMETPHLKSADSYKRSVILSLSKDQFSL
jgi:hypothetical protein